MDGADNAQGGPRATGVEEGGWAPISGPEGCGLPFTSVKSHRQNPHIHLLMIFNFHDDFCEGSHGHFTGLTKV